MYEHDAEYICQYRPAPGVSERDTAPRQKVVERELGFQRPERLSWPRNQFGESATIAELMAEAAQS
jgi:hypothetical protein